MRCNKKDPETGKTCGGDLVPFGRNMYGYRKCNVCGKLYLFEEKQTRLKFK